MTLNSSSSQTSHLYAFIWNESQTSLKAMVHTTNKCWRPIRSTLLDARKFEVISSFLQKSSGKLCHDIDNEYIVSFRLNSCLQVKYAESRTLNAREFQRHKATVLSFWPLKLCISDSRERIFLDLSIFHAYACVRRVCELHRRVPIQVVELRINSAWTGSCA